MFLWIFDTCFMENLICLGETTKASGRCRFKIRLLVLRLSPQGYGHLSGNILELLFIIYGYFMAIFWGGVSRIGRQVSSQRRNPLQHVSTVRYNATHPSEPKPNYNNNNDNNKNNNKPGGAAVSC